MLLFCNKVLKNFKRFIEIFVFQYFLVYLQMKIYKLNHKSIFT
nr:MAG TPA: hypothetical protein [Caudoviricetes sp.]